MSIDHNLESPAKSPLASAIENELPTYRAVSVQAVIALICGVLAILCFTSAYFYVFSVAAIVLGFSADRTIQRFPQMLTGRGLAQTGFGLGLIFGLASLSVTTVQYFLRGIEAGRFATTIESVLRDKTVDDAIWYMQPPNVRESVAPADLVSKIRKDAGPDTQMAETQWEPVRSLKKALAENGASLHYEGLEAHGEDGLNMVATALYRIDSPQAKSEDQREQHALAILKSTKHHGKTEWWTSEYRFPYKPKSYVAPAKAVDDGHGHAEGGAGAGGEGGGHSAGDGHNH